MVEGSAEGEGNKMKDTCLYMAARRYLPIVYYLLHFLEQADYVVSLVRVEGRLERRVGMWATGT